MIQLVNVHCACPDDQTLKCTYFLLTNLNGSAQDEDELTVLHCAAGEGHEPIARLLLSRAPYLANEQSK